MVQNREPTDFTDLVPQVIYLVVSPQFGDLLKCSIMDVHIANKYFLQLFQKTLHTAGILHTDQCIPRPKCIVGQINILLISQIIIILFLVYSIWNNILATHMVKSKSLYIYFFK